MRVSTKIWLGLGAVVLGYIACLGTSLHFTNEQERRLRFASTTALPATAWAQRALADLRVQGRAYQDAVLFGEVKLLESAAAGAQEVQLALDTVLSLPGLEDDVRLRLSQLKAAHEDYVAKADPLYRLLATGGDADLSAAGALNQRYESLISGIAIVATGFAESLRRQQEDGVIATVLQRQINFAVFASVITVSVGLMAIGTIGSGRRLVALAIASERMSTGNYDAPIEAARPDEIGVLATALTRMRDSIQERDQQLRAFNDSLRRQVDERTTDLLAANSRLEGINRELDAERAALAEKLDELRQTRDALVAAQQQEALAHRNATDAARQAGMAEVAIGVLHNVGNVLNSVNVSAAMAQERIEGMRLGRLSKAAQLLDKPPEELAAFLVGDERGRQLPVYLAKLAAVLEEDALAAKKELAELDKNIEHIRGIIAVQQAYAGGAGMIEAGNLIDVVRDAIRINGSALQRHSVTVVEDYQPLPPLLFDKHKVMQIVVNLIANAKDALSEVAPLSRTMRIRVAAVGDTVEIAVEDSGVGIAADNLQRLFQHGFTTKKDGHGFGLHSGFLTAKEMGGRLLARSEGAGRGAQFILELPYRAAGDAT